MTAGRPDDRAEVVRDLPGLADEWEALCARLGAPPSLHPGPFVLWCEAYGVLGRARAVAVRRGGALVAVLPLLLRRWRISTGAMRELVETGVVAEDDASADAAVHAALGVPLGRLTLRPVAEDGPTHRALVRAGRPMLVRRVDRYGLVDVATDWEEYWRTRSRNVRSDVTRRRRRLAEAGALEIVIRDGSEGLDADLATIFAIEASGWKGAAGTALAADPAGAAFYRQLARWAAARGWLRLSLLRLDGRPIAFHYSLQGSGVLYALKIGYDEAMARYSPGKVLLAAEIERAFREGLRQFDFAGSPAPYKTAWSTGHRDLLEVALFPRTGVGRPAQAVEMARLRALPVAKALRARVRKLSRRPRARTR